MNENMDEHHRLAFIDVYQHEKEDIKTRRKRQFYVEGKQGDDAEQHFVGLALSGGGIRSATFCLGFLQQLHRLKLLRIFDYLSTVSGGGYVGGWWSAWLSREEGAIRTREECPLFTPSDLHNPASFVARVSNGGDPVSIELLDQMHRNESGEFTYRLLARAGNGDTPDPELIRKLVVELNSYLTRPAANDSAAVVGNSEDEKKAAAARERDLMWANRLRLEQEFPYELRNVFPPDEKIEPQRRYAQGADQGSEGSLCAWEDPIHHLRLFANYLTPRKGMLSADTWRAVSVVTRNLFLTWLILLPLVTAVMLLGQAYFLLNPFTGADFAGGKPISLSSTLAPLLVLLVWSVLVAVAWLMCNRDNASSTDGIVQTAGLAALVALLASGVYALRQYRLVVVRPDFLVLSTGRLVGIAVLTVLTMVALLTMWFWGLKNGQSSGEDPETVARWKRDVRRGRFSRAQARLLVTMVLVAAVLFVSWLSTKFSFGTDSGPSVSFLKIPVTYLRIGILPLLTALGGSIFTALRATPTAGSDVQTTREPSRISRVIFAVTPPLVVVVLAMLAAILAHELVVRFHGGFYNAKYMLNVAAVLLIALCMALAVYEMKDIEWSKILNLSLASVIFICLLMVNISWGGQALLVSVYGAFGNEGSGNSNWITLLLLVVSAAMAVIIAAIVFRRLIPRGTLKGELKKRLKTDGELKQLDPQRREVMARRFIRLSSLIGIAVFSVPTIVGYLIGTSIFFRTNKIEDSGLASLFGALMLSFVSLAGGVILFRLALSRDPVSQHHFELKWFKDKPFGKAPETLWLLAALCLTLPVAMVCLGHYLRACHIADRSRFVFFPITLTLLFGVLILFRSLAVQTLVRNGKPLVGSSLALFNWIFAKIPGATEYKQLVFQLLAFFAVGATILVGPAAQNLYGLSVFSPRALGMRANWVLLGVVLLVNLPIFGMSVLQLPLSFNQQPSLVFRSRSWLHRRFSLWVIALVCILLALTAGYLLPYWLNHLSEVPLNEGLIPILLPGATGCFLFVLFEMYWGERDNRRSLWLIGFAYLGFATIFFMKLAEGSQVLQSWQIILGLLAAIAVWVGALGWMVDPNAVSMHQFYRGRLVRAYLGASNVRRRLQGNKEITETVAGDDLPLKSLLNCERGGPYHLINTTLNLVGGRDLATAQRSASSFTLSQKYCGSPRTDYCPTAEYMNGQLSLGTAIAASGAAVSPNMGSKKPTAALAMLMTLLNVRLGYWAPTPNREGWNSSQPRLWPFYLIREFLSQTNDVSTYCYLTDGGHFDNTGLYSLLERACRYVVLVDCSADPEPCFQDLGEAIRRCRIDFGTEIDLCLDTFIATPEKPAERCYTVGTILFSRDHLSSLGRICQECADSPEDKLDRTGTIIYFKPSVIENLTADVRQYAIENSFFPQQSTANQWFDEAQFESYRRLGQQCAKSAFDNETVREMSRINRLSMKDIEELFRGISSTSGTQTA
jgi:hypothetical protein